jgi:hypothetical protein
LTASAPIANNPPMAWLAPDKPRGMLIPVDQRSAPLVAISTHRPSTSFA